MRQIKNQNLAQLLAQLRFTPQKHLRKQLDAAEKLLAKKPAEMIRMAVKGMLPKNSLGRQMIRKLKIYAGTNHPHEAQKPISLEI